MNDTVDQKQMCRAAFLYLMVGKSLEGVAEEMGLSVAETKRILATFRARVLANTKTRSPRSSGAEGYWQALQKQDEG